MNIIAGIHPIDEISKTTGFYESDIIYLSHKEPNPRLQKILFKAKRAGARIEYAPFKKLDEMSQTGKHQGIILKREEEQKYNEFTEDDFIFEHEAGLYVLIHKMDDPRNIGAIIRTMSAFGAKGIILSKTNTPPLGESAWKTSSGALAYMPVLFVNGLPSFLKRCQKAQTNMFIVSADINGEHLSNQKIQELKKQYKKILIVLGSESKGVTSSLDEFINLKIKIPQNNSPDSLNVSVAAGIMIYPFSNFYVD